jgi:HPt (histidine-containing phosphotransfer) domain-containing protein
MEPAVNSQELMESIGGNRELLVELVELFRQDSPVQVQDVRASIGCRHAKQVEYTAHSLKGTLASLFAPRAHQLAVQLEEMGRSGQLEQADRTLAELEAELSRVATALDGLCIEASRG